MIAAIFGRGKSRRREDRKIVEEPYGAYHPSALGSFDSEIKRLNSIAESPEVR